MTVDNEDGRSQSIRLIPARVPAHVGGLTTLRAVARCLAESGVGAVLVENPLGPVGIVTSADVIEAVASGADPDTVWAGDIARPAPRIVSCTQHPVEVGEEMAAYRLEIVAVVDEDSPVALASALDVLEGVLRAGREPRQPHS